MTIRLNHWLSFTAGVMFALLVLLGGFFCVLSSGSINPGADQPIPAVERWAAKTSIRAFLKKNTPETKNPLPITDANLLAGCKLYLNNCAVCHGLADGNTTRIAEGFYKSAPQFSNEDWSKDADGLLYWFIEHGVRLTAMPAYSRTLNENEKWQIVMFIKQMRSLPDSVKGKWRAVESVDIAR